MKNQKCFKGALPTNSGTTPTLTLQHHTGTVKQPSASTIATMADSMADGLSTMQTQNRRRHNQKQTSDQETKAKIFINRLKTLTSTFGVVFYTQTIRDETFQLAGNQLSEPSHLSAISALIGSTNYILGLGASCPLPRRQQSDHSNTAV